MSPEMNATNLKLLIQLYLQPKLIFTNKQLRRLSHLLTIPYAFILLLTLKLDIKRSQNALIFK